MHECWECGTMCDCDGEDMHNPCPPDHVCINPECDGEDDIAGDLDDPPPAAAPRET